MKKRYIFSLFLLCTMIVHFGVYQWTHSADAPISKIYPARFGDHSAIYDGDTLQDIYITIKQFDNADYPAEVLWPGVFLKEDTLYAVTDIRIKHIDTPEKRPLKAGRTKESLNREKTAAEAAKNALSVLLKTYNMDFVVAEPEGGKYYGRIVADVLVGPDRISAADYLIEQGYAYRYEGGRKIAFDDWYKK